jgi:hypothetical protein
MTREYKEKEKISFDLSGELLKRFDDACENEHAEPNKRAFQLRTLMREYCERQGV